MSVVDARPYGGDGKSSRPDLSDDVKGGTKLAGARYVYYRLYTKDGPLESNHLIYSNDRFISRISSKSVRPPYTVAMLKKYICKVEGIKSFERSTLYKSISDQTALPDSTRPSFQGTSGPGLSDLDPVALVVEQHTAENRSQAASPVDPLQLVENNYEKRYVYYVVYDDDGWAVSKTSFDENNAFLGRVNTLSIPPPHNVASIKYHLIKSEEILDQNVQLFEDGDSESPMDDSDTIALLADTFPGFAEDRYIVIAYESQGNTSQTDKEDPNEIRSRELREACSALEESQRELVQLREEVENRKETHARELREATSALDRLKDEVKKSNEALWKEASPAQLEALSERPSFTKKFKAAQNNDDSFDEDPIWHPMKTGAIFYTDGGEVDSASKRIACLGK